MISWMQKHRKYLVVTIWISTIAFVGAGFVGWGAYSYNQDRSNAVAKVGDKKITNKELQSTYSNIYNYYNQMLGGKLTQEKADQLHLQSIALNQLIQEGLLLNYAKDKGIIALEDEVLEKIQSIDAFKDKGAFSKERYFQVLKSINTDPKTFEANMKKEIILAKLKKLLNLPVLEDESKMVFASAYMSDKLSVKNIKVADENLSISEEDVKKFWEKNKTKYLSKKSYTLEATRINATDIKVADDTLKAFYDDNKQLFKGKDDKILPFEKAKEKVIKKLQMKKAKTAILKKYLAIKNSKEKAEKTITVAEGNNEIPTQKIATASEGDYIKSIELDDGYLTAKLVSVNKPSPLKYEEAKKLAKADLTIQKRYKALEEKAKKSMKDFKGAKDIGFVSRDDTKKLDFLDEAQAAQFLNNLFSQQKKSGYFIFEDKAIVYKITDQKLFDAKKYAEKKVDITKSTQALKGNSAEKNLIKKLQNKYKIEKYVKG